MFLKRISFWILAMAIIFATFLSACAQSASPAPTAAPKSAAPAEKSQPAASSAKDKPAAEKPAAADKKPAALEKVKVVYTSVSVIQTVPWLAKDKGIFEKYGLDVDISLVQSTPPAVAALMAGEAQMLIGAQEAVITSVFAGSDLEFIIGGPPKVLFALYGDKTINSVKDLKGKKVGITKYGTSTEFATKFALREAGIDPAKDVAMMQVGTMPDILTALGAGAVQGATFSPPTDTQAKKQGFKMLYDVSSAAFNFHNAGVIVRKSWIPGHEETIRNFAKAYIEATAAVKKDKATTMATIEKWTKVTDKDQLSESYDSFVKVTPEKPYVVAEALKTTLDDMKDEPKAQAADPKQFFDNRFIEELDKNGFIDSIFKK